MIEAYYAEEEDELTDDAKLGVYPILQFFTYDHLPPELAAISAPFRHVAFIMAGVPGNAETAAGLRKLLEAKDCAVRAALIK